MLHLLAGLGGAGALYFTWRNFNRTVQDSAATQELARESRTSENFIKAVEQLGSGFVPVRVGGIYGLGRLLNIASIEGDYWPIMDILTAFIRQSSPVQSEPRHGNPPEDIQAAVTVLARRSEHKAQPREGDSPVDLHDTDLSYLWMSGGHFEWGYFIGSSFVKTELDNAKLNGAIFDRANLTNSYFNHANLVYSRLHEVKSAAGATFYRADLTGADFFQSDLRGANFDEANLRDADLSQALLDAKQLDKAFGNLNTKLPVGFIRPA